MNVRFAPPRLPPIGRKATTAMVANNLSGGANGLTLSPGERGGVMASVKTKLDIHLRKISFNCFVVVSKSRNSASQLGFKVLVSVAVIALSRALA